VVPSDAKARLLTEFKDLDTVLGGGILMGSVSLLAGQPGIGKSTLLMQICTRVARKHDVLYISGEESAGQVKLRAERLGADSDRLNFAASTSANDIAKTIETGEFDLVIVDSIQTLTLAEISSAPGTVSQVTNSGNLIIRAAKQTDTAVIIVGHVTKEGTLAGPKVLEHLVDVVLNFEGDRYGGFKTVRAVKNRFGSTNEVAIFEMLSSGLNEVENPSAALLAERTNTDGSVILATLNGNRPILVEIQALVNASNYGYPKRTASGFDINRLNLLIAVLEKRTKLRLNDKDIFINVVGGMKLADAAADLAIAIAIASAVAGRKLGDEYVVFGEVGLGGEIRSAFRADQRIAEAKKLGFLHAIGPSTVKDKFVIPTKDLRETLIKFVK
ncbi:DNA repair protein RadA, partial [Candidatus Saccharibacteria bacterium]|nr:DNA repair protein RadA [Candidatus Saccharibacteria bacterium]